MGLREKEEAFMDALVENARQSLAMAENIAGFLKGLEETDTFYEDDAFMEDDTSAQEQPVSSEKRMGPADSDKAEFFARAVETLEALIAAMDGEIILIDEDEDYFEE